MREPLVSIIIPTYKRDETLISAIEVAINQTYKNTEIIVVNDNGVESNFTPKVRFIVEKYKNYGIRYVENEHNLGGSGARNEGIKVSKGEFIAFLDDDDEISDDKIEKQIEVFNKSKDDMLALVYCYVQQIGADRKVNYILKVKYSGNCLYKALTIDCLAPTSLWLVRKSALEAVGMFDIVPNKQDATLILKLLMAGYKVDFVPEVLCTYANYNIGEKITTYGLKQINGELLYLEKCRKAYTKLPKWQQRNIEFAFSSRFWGLHRMAQMNSEMEADRRNMYRCNFVKAFLFFSKINLKKIIRNNIL